MEGGSFEFCIAALSGAASNDFNVTVERSYLRGKNRSAWPGSTPVLAVENSFILENKAFK